MSYIRIIDNETEWDEAIKQFEDIDSYYSYEYGNLFAKREKGKLFAAYFINNTTKIFYPFIKRTVLFEDRDIFDIVTPYGYGGPFIEGYASGVNHFYKDFSDYCNKNGIITETIRFHPLIWNHNSFKNIIDVQYIRQTTTVSLIPPLEKIRENYSEMNKRNIKKAKRNAIHCYVAEKSLENIKIFSDMYKETMDRNHAGNFYYFDDSFFMEQLKDTGISKNFLLFAKYSDQIIAGVIVMVGQKFSHYHFGASKAGFLDLRPNNLLFDYMIEFSKSMGTTSLHLGGGYQENDGLYKFKSSFSNNNNSPYYIGRKIHNLSIYTEIMEKFKKNYEVDEDYFPAYRGLKAKKIFTT
jgi:hypothetical protein